MLAAAKPHVPVCGRYRDDLKVQSPKSRRRARGAAFAQVRRREGARLRRQVILYVHGIPVADLLG